MAIVCTHKYDTRSLSFLRKHSKKTWKKCQLVKKLARFNNDDKKQKEERRKAAGRCASSRARRGGGEAAAAQSGQSEAQGRRDVKQPSPVAGGRGYLPPPVPTPPPLLPAPPLTASLWGCGGDGAWRPFKPRPLPHPQGGAAGGGAGSRGCPRRGTPPCRGGSSRFAYCLPRMQRGRPEGGNGFLLLYLKAFLCNHGSHLSVGIRDVNTLPGEN